MGATNSTAATVTVYPTNTVVLDLQVLAGLPTLSIDAPPASEFRIESSTNLNFDHWTSLGIFSPTTNPFIVLDTNARNAALRFYRTVPP